MRGDVRGDVRGDADGLGPVFGERVPGVEYVPRPSAYALVADDRGRLAVVRNPSGCHLPGGGVEEGETEAGTIVREGREECGMTLRASRLVGRAVELVWSVSDEKWYEKTCAFLAAEWDGALHAREESDHHLRWLHPAEAARALTLESHRWAVERWMDGGRTA